MSTSPRIPPLPPSERDERTEELLASLRGPVGDDLNLFATLAHHPRLLKRWSAFGGLLLFGGELPDRDREVLILRTAANCGADYEWGHHTGLGRAAGLTEEDLVALARPTDVMPDDGDALLVRAADELHEDGELGDETWAELAARYSDAQLIELCMVVGQYHLVAFTLRSLRIQPEPGTEEMPS